MLTEKMVVDNIYQLINTEEVNSVITGKIYKYVRPYSSDKTDIVIVPLPIQSGEPQRCVFNLNIYNKIIEATGTPNATELDNIAKQLISILEEGNANDSVIFSFNTVGTMADMDRKDTMFKNIRVEAFTIEEE